MSEYVVLDLATHGQDGYDMYRVPGITVTGTGDVLVYYEGRLKDASRRVLLARRSTDMGKTFCRPFLLKEATSGVMLHNPLMLCGQNNELFFFWNEDYQRLYMQKSCDGGHSWNAPVNLTQTVLGWCSAWPLTLFAVAPGHGLRMRNGTLVVPLWLSRGINSHKPACFSTLYSSDNGVSWKRGSLVCSNEAVMDPTEGSVVELSDGRWALDILLL